MMKRAYTILILLLCIYYSKAQDVFLTRSGQISFFSKTPLENIVAVNNGVYSALNKKSGEIVFAVLIKGFHFERALMEEHFNESYMESDKFPKSTFKGKINDITFLSSDKEGSYNVIAEGDLTIHGITKKVTFPGKIIIKDGQLQLLAKFKVLIKDFNIKVPAIMAEKIDETITVSVDCKYEAKK